MGGVEIYSDYILKENLNVFYQSSEKSREKAWNASLILIECVWPGKFRMYSRTLWVLEKKSHILSRDARICVMVLFSIQWFMSSHYVGFFRHKETNLVENKQTTEWKIFNSQSNVESVKDIKNTKHYVSTDFCNATVGFKIVIFVKLWRVRKPLLLNFSHFIFNLIDFFFCSKNGTCCYLHKWDIEQGKCIRK